MKNFLILFFSLLPLGLRAQVEPEGVLKWVRLPEYQLQYHVPADWVPLHQTTDTSLVITCYNPDRTLLFSAGKLRGAADKMPPAEALAYFTKQHGVALNKPTAATYDGINFLETNGIGSFNGKSQRYQALAGQNQGHLLLVYITGEPAVFLAHQGEINRVLHSMTAYKKRARAK